MMDAVVRRAHTSLASAIVEGIAELSALQRLIDG
jgi:hypothetical protein